MIDSLSSCVITVFIGRQLSVILGSAVLRADAVTVFNVRELL